MKQSLLAVVAITVALVGPSLASPDTPTPSSAATTPNGLHQTSAGPCNMVTVNVNARDLSHGIINGFTVQRTAELGSLTVKEIKTYFLITIRTGNLSCTTTASASQVGQSNTLLTPTPTGKPLAMDCNSTKACSAQGLVRVTAQMHPRQKITVLTGGQ
jgi:hypothetical protein